MAVGACGGRAQGPAGAGAEGRGAGARLRESALRPRCEGLRKCRRSNRALHPNASQATTKLGKKKKLGGVAGAPTRARGWSRKESCTTSSETT
eukprot:scaffold5793_cov105-Isochrysis_galbana.AAC.2